MSDPSSILDSARPRFLRGELLNRTAAVAAELRESAVERDRRGGTAKAERDLLRRSGLLGAFVAPELGGHGASWPELFESVRVIARADGSFGHVYGFQHLLLATSRLFGSADQWQPLHRETVERRWFWGNALNPLDSGTTIARLGSDFVINGKKSFSSGSVDADQLIVSAHEPETGKLVVAAVPANRQGIVALGDWDNMGQRQTDSGTVEFRDVVIGAREILSTPGPLGSVFAGLRSLIAQLTLANVYLGIAEGALVEARSYTLSSRRAWPPSGVQNVADDPYVAHHYADFFVAIESARALADRAAESLQDAYTKADSLTETERGATAVLVATAKVTSTRAALKITAEIFEVMGARATAARLNLDRFWRNARTHTLHDPVDYKLRELGQFALAGRLPTPTFYS